MKIIGNLLSIALGVLLPTPIVFAQPASADREFSEFQLDKNFSTLIEFKEINLTPFTVNLENYQGFSVQKNLAEEAKSSQIDCDRNNYSTELFTNQIILESVSGIESNVTFARFKTENKPKKEDLKIDSLMSLNTFLMWGD